MEVPPFVGRAARRVLAWSAACALLVGFKTRWAIAACWLIYGIPIRQGLLDPDASIFLGQYVLVLFPEIRGGVHGRGVVKSRPRPARRRLV